MKTKLSILVIALVLPLFSSAQWTPQVSGFSDSLRGIESIWMANEKVAWAIARDDSGNDSIIQEFTRTTNGGQNWISGNINNAAGHTPTHIFALDSLTAWTTMYNPNTDGGKIMKTTDGGQNWVHQSTAIFSSALEAYPNMVYFWNANEGFCMGDPTNNYFEIYTTQNGGALWSRVDSALMPPLISGEYGYAGYFSVVGDKLWFGTSKGRIFSTSDKGHHWSQITTPFTNTGKIRFVQFKDSLHGIIGDRSNNSFILYTTANGGASWQVLSPNGTVYGRNVVYVEGTQGTLISVSNATGYSGSSISHDFGQNWSVIPASAGMEITALSNFKRQGGFAGLVNPSPNQGGMAHLQLFSADAGIAEFIHPHDACLGLHPFYIRIKNYGHGILDSVIMDWSLDGLNVTPQTIPLHLAAGESDTLVGLLVLGSSGSKNFIAYTSLPNGLVDTIPGNDSIHYTIQVHPNPAVNLGSDTLILSTSTLLLDAGSGFSSYSWSNGDTSQTLLVDSLFNNYNTNTQITVFVVDSFGCTGQGSVKILMSYTGIAEQDNTTGFLLYPNPSDGKIYIQSNKVLAHGQMEILDESGRLMQVIQLESAGKTEVDISHLKRGFYLFRISSEGAVYTQKIIVR